MNDPKNSGIGASGPTDDPRSEAAALRERASRTAAAAMREALSRTAFELDTIAALTEAERDGRP